MGMRHCYICIYMHKLQVVQAGVLRSQKQYDPTIVLPTRCLYHQFPSFADGVYTTPWATLAILCHWSIHLPLFPMLPRNWLHAIGTKQSPWSHPWRRTSCLSRFGPSCSQGGITGHMRGTDWWPWWWWAVPWLWSWSRAMHWGRGYAMCSQTGKLSGHRLMRARWWNSRLWCRGLRLGTKSLVQNCL